MCTLPPIVFIVSLKHVYPTLFLTVKSFLVNTHFYHKDRGSHGGGVLIAVSDSVPSVLISSPEELEIISVSLNFLNRPTTLCTVYVSPNSGDDYHKNLLSYLLKFHLLLTA